MRIGAWWVGVIGIAGAGGCVIVQKDTQLDDAVFTEPVASVVADVGAGSLVVSVDDGVSEVTVRRTARWTGDAPEADAWVEGGVLHLEVHCPALKRVCEVDHEVILPNAAALEAVLGSGDLVATGLTGAITADVGSGNVTLNDVNGDVVASTGSGDMVINGAIGTVDASTGSGDIEATEVDVSTFHASTGSGDAVLALVGAPTRVSVETGSGDVALTVPAGAYQVSAEVGGDLSMTGITAEDAANAVIEITTGSGDASIVGI